MGEVTTYRYTRDTIRNQMWENSIIETEGKIILSEIHMKKDDGEIIKEIEKELTPEQSQKYKEKNKMWLIEIYSK
jgi:hypothetical protein